jgi:glycosyltransferase involved in cell wall biosynthesis
MKILFVHQNFPAQFKHLSVALVRLGHDVRALTMRRHHAAHWQGVQWLTYGAQRGSTPGIHPWVADFESKVIRGEACFRAAWGLRQNGYTPDLIIAHPGWGEGLFLKQVWPTAQLGMYCEYHYQAEGGDVGFDPEFPLADPAGEASRLRLKNLNQQLHAEIADAALSPTQWQASTYPLPLRDRITVVHDGIDTQALAPKADAHLSFTTADGTSITLTRNDEVVTFVNRQLEPYRGYHVFMRALPEWLHRHPKAQVLVVGGEGVSYGAAPHPARYGARSWKQIFIDEVRPRMAEADWARVHFLGHLPYPDFISLLQISRVHVYLTYPFVLSWSLIEAMSVGCAIVASDTGPVREVLTHGGSARLVDFFDMAGLGQHIGELLQNPAERERLGSAARAHARQHHDLRTVCLPKQLQWVEQMAQRATAAPAGARHQ